jgi:hypothetical protein
MVLSQARQRPVVDHHTEIRPRYDDLGGLMGQQPRVTPVIHTLYDWALMLAQVRYGSPTLEGINT